MSGKGGINLQLELIKRTFVKSPINYTGGKHKLLPQFQEFFPQNVHTFVDFFTGGANIAINAEAERILAFDNNCYVISLFQFLKHNDISYVVSRVEEIISYYELSNSIEHGYEYYECTSGSGLGPYNKQKYLKLRDDYNNDSTTFERDLLFFVLIVFGFNNQIRFNKSGHFNIPVGKRDFNVKIRKNLKDFMDSLNSSNLHFEEKDFRDIPLQHFGPKDFFYVDPPYLITTATYNEQGGWTRSHEEDLLNILDKLNEQGVRFALSNVIEKNEMVNDLLIEWSKKYNIHNMKINYQNSNYQKKRSEIKEREVLITNY